MRIQEIFTCHFKFTCTEDNIIRYLNACIIVNPHGISLDITDHIIHNVLADYWKDRKAPCTSSTFPLKSSFKEDLFFALPLIGSELKDMEKQENGSLYKWANTLQFLVQRSRLDIGYAVMWISGYMSAPNKPIFDVLHLTMAFLYHHPHCPIMYLSKQLEKIHMARHFGAGKTKYLKAYKSFLVGAADSDLA
eukprot:4536106-Ditylum_brightwellii.AAC.1